MANQLPFSVNQYLCPAGMSPVEFLERISRCNFSGAGVIQGALEQMGSSALRRELRGRSLAASSLNTAGFFLYEGAAAERQAERNLWLLEQASELGSVRLNVIVGGSATLPLQVARDRAVNGLEAFAREARARGVQLMVEPLHHLNVRTKSCFNSISQLVPVFERIPGLALNADLFHLWWDPDLDAVLRGNSIPVGLLQICDVAISESAPAPKRVPLGEGVVPWSDHVRAVQNAFPAVPIELELFADQLPGRDLEQLLAASATALSRLAHF